MPTDPRRARAALAAVVLAACSGALPPLRHHLEAGRDPYVILVADAPDGRGDLWATGAAGGDAIQVTFTLPAEFGPALSPDGGLIVFLRAREEADTARRITVLNLLNGAERELPLPPEAGWPMAVRWSPDLAWVVARTSTGLWRVAAPPRAAVAEPVPDAEAAAADSLFAVFVGDPPFARVERCGEEEALCVLADTTVSLLAPGARAPVRWGGDSVAYQVGDELVVRSLGPGRSRVIRLDRFRNPRGFTVFPGAPRRAGE